MNLMPSTRPILPFEVESRVVDGLQTLTTLDLFAGAGGLTQGFAEVGTYVSRGAVEIDSEAAATFRLNHGAVHASSIEEWLDTSTVPEVDVVIGGPPCQGFSLLGKRDASDARNGLWREYVRALLQASPRYFVMENVGAFLKTPEFEALKESTEPRGLLADYACDVRVLNAADYGAAQNRRRAIVIGHRKDIPAPGIPFPTHLGVRRTVRDAWQGVPLRPKGMDLPDRRFEQDGYSYAGPFRSDELHLTRNFAPVTLARIRCIPPGGNRFDLPDHLLSPCWRRHKTGSGDVMGRLFWDRPSVTIRTEFFKPEKGRYLHPSEHRAITPFEAARIQGFPDDYLWAGSKTAISRQIGNAVPVPLGRAIAQHLAVAATTSLPGTSADLRTEAAG